MTIEQIEATPIVGNHASDMPLFDAIDDFVVDPNNPMPEKIRALRKMDQAMGEDSEVTEADVAEFIQESLSVRGG